MRTPRHFASLMAMALVASVAAATSGCASNAPYASASLLERPSRDIAVRVTNNNWQDVRIYLVTESGSRPLRVGVVPGLTSAIFTMRHPPQGRARFLLRPIGTRATYTTNAVMAVPGRSLELTVHNALSLSNLISR